MKRLISLVFMATILITTVLTKVEAQEKDLTEELNLSPKQIEQIRELNRIQTRNEERLQAQIRAKEEEIKKELAKEEEPNKERIRTMVKELNQLRSELFESRINSIIETRKVLNRDQIRQWTRTRLMDGTGGGSQYQHQYQKGTETTRGSGQTPSGSGNTRGRN